ncbi:MAG TPA: TIGR00266 family protein [Actinomycetota bacterium]
MDVDIRFSPSFAVGVITIAPGGEVKAEAGAMTSMSGGVEIGTKAQGGLMGGLKRSVLGGESFFINTFRAPQGGELTVSPTLPGDIVHMPVDASKALMVQSGSWLASEPGVEVDTKWGGGKTFFSGEGLFLLRCTGSGDMLVSSYGAIERRSLGAGEVLKIDTGHIVAFEEGMGYEVNKVGGWKSTLLSGEGLVATLTGPGELWMQTRSPADFIGWLIPQLPTQRS